MGFQRYRCFRHQEAPGDVTEERKKKDKLRIRSIFVSFTTLSPRGAGGLRLTRCRVVRLQALSLTAPGSEFFQISWEGPPAVAWAPAGRWFLPCSRGGGVLCQTLWMGRGFLGSWAAGCTPRAAAACLAGLDAGTAARHCPHFVDQRLSTVLRAWTLSAVQPRTPAPGVRSRLINADGLQDEGTRTNTWARGILRGPWLARRTKSLTDP